MLVVHVESCTDCRGFDFHDGSHNGRSPNERAREEFPVVIPLATQQYLLLQRNLVYTGITRGKKLVVVVGQRKALAIAVRNNKTEQRFSGLLARLLVPS
jgi:hypothetical protein